jgi:hypothetical protein
MMDAIEIRSELEELGINQDDIDAYLNFYNHHEIYFQSGDWNALADDFELFMKEQA